jgi:hypothetical protein
MPLSNSFYSLTIWETKRLLIRVTLTRTLAWYGHVNHVTWILQGTIKGARRRGRQRNAWLDVAWLDNVKHWTEQPIEVLLRQTENRVVESRLHHRQHGTPTMQVKGLGEEWGEVGWGKVKPSVSDSSFCFTLPTVRKHWNPGWCWNAWNIA